VVSYLDDALRAGARCVKVHVQVGAFDPRSELLDKAWAMIADAGVPAVVHCGHGPVPGEFTGLDVFGEVLARYPGLPAVLAHAGMPEVDRALDSPVLPADRMAPEVGPPRPRWGGRGRAHHPCLAAGTDFPSIPHPYAEQLAAIAGWAAADGRLGERFLRAVLHDTPALLLGCGIHS